MAKRSERRPPELGGELVGDEADGAPAEQAAGGATRNTRSPSPGPASLPTAPVSQNSEPRPAAAAAAGLEMVLP